MLFTQNKTEKKVNANVEKFTELQNKRISQWKASKSSIPMKDLREFLKGTVNMLEIDLTKKHSSDTLQRLSGIYSAYKTLQLLIENNIDPNQVGS